eukprot:NODE_6014_length_938_cov_43.273620_g5426_i0.p1 GENE.NODE_6014_length_938_cov_43.273620_g5426_i0~~NODE_6014_length_938_cov_43.273620_g5426_i0.p1  ORF type:complete len:243 (-),score=34.76 NODE_6014_length_938_cov_43.273620_g5426_i0:141-869(-)
MARYYGDGGMVHERPTVLFQRGGEAMRNLSPPGTRPWHGRVKPPKHTTDHPISPSRVLYSDSAVMFAKGTNPNSELWWSFKEPSNHEDKLIETECYHVSCQGNAGSPVPCIRYGSPYTDHEHIKPLYPAHPVPNVEHRMGEEHRRLDFDHFDTNVNKDIKPTESKPKHHQDKSKRHTKDSTRQHSEYTSSHRNPNYNTQKSIAPQHKQSYSSSTPTNTTPSRPIVDSCGHVSCQGRCRRYSP